LGSRVSWNKESIFGWAIEEASKAHQVEVVNTLLRVSAREELVHERALHEMALEDRTLSKKRRCN
jgi:hypothetical protein